MTHNQLGNNSVTVSDETDKIHVMLLLVSLEARTDCSLRGLTMYNFGVTRKKSHVLPTAGHAREID